MASFFNRKDTNMTEGNIIQHLVRFSVPLLIGNIFQVLYNTVDSIVVGNFIGKEALAAVGNVSPIINTLIGFFLGLAAGAALSYPSIMAHAMKKACTTLSIRRC